MRISFRQLFLIAVLAAAAIVAGARLAHAQATNPSAIQFESADHGSVTFYEVCFYPSATSTTVIRCNQVPITQVSLVSGTTYRIPRASWSANLPINTDLFPKVRILAANDFVGAEVAPSVAPFSFRLVPRPVTSVTLVP